MKFSVEQSGDLATLTVEPGTAEEMAAIRDVFDRLYTSGPVTIVNGRELRIWLPGAMVRPVNPLDGLPLDEWWRLKNGTWCQKIDAFNRDHTRVSIDRHVVLVTALATDYEHTPNPLDPAAVWVTGWEAKGQS